MSPENVEVARRAYETFNAGDISGWLPLHSADAEIHDLPNVPDPGVKRGHAEIRTWAEEMIETTEYLRFEAAAVYRSGRVRAGPRSDLGKGTDKWGAD
jgi:ketosteroid isomerase-like protein